MDASDRFPQTWTPRPRRVAALSVIILLTGAGIAAADPGPHGAPNREIAVHAFNTDNEGVQPDGVSCSVSAGGCSIRDIGHAVWTGDFTGRSSYVLRFTPKSDATFAYEGTEHLPVLVNGCGLGTFDMRITGGVYDPKKSLAAPGSPAVDDHDQWSVISGSGTGALVGLSGQGTEIITDNENGTSKAELTGTVVCHPR